MDSLNVTLFLLLLTGFHGAEKDYSEGDLSAIRRSLASPENILKHLTPTNLNFPEKTIKDRMVIHDLQWHKIHKVPLLIPVLFLIIYSIRKRRTQTQNGLIKKSINGKTLLVFFCFKWLRELLKELTSPFGVFFILFSFESAAWLSMEKQLVMNEIRKGDLQSYLFL